MIAAALHRIIPVVKTMNDLMISSSSIMQRAHAIARHLSERGAHVVSGGALGIDGAAHRGVLAGEGAGQTIVVLGSGVDVAVSRSRHAQLFERRHCPRRSAREMFPLGMQPRRGTFPSATSSSRRCRCRRSLIEAQVKRRTRCRRRGREGTSAGSSCDPREQQAAIASIAGGAALVESGEDMIANHRGKPARSPRP